LTIKGTNLMLQLKINPDQCIGCRACELACALENDGVMASGCSRITVISFIESREYGLPYHFPTTCRQCEDAPCLIVCPEDAIVKDKREDRIVRINTEICTGCGQCVRACPFGAIRVEMESHKAVKCELCKDQPACVSICPTDAITFTEGMSFVAKHVALQMHAYSLLRDNAKQRHHARSQSDD